MLDMDSIRSVERVSGTRTILSESNLFNHIEWHGLEFRGCHNRFYPEPERIKSLNHYGLLRIPRPDDSDRHQFTI